MELRQLRYFVAVATDEHFSHAATRLHVAQPALSRQVRLLEEELGVPLFERLPRGVRLTRAGRRFLRDTERVLAQLDEARARAQHAAREELGPLRVGFAEPAMWSGTLPRILHEFRTRHPEAELTLVPLNSADQWSALRDGRLDAGFVYSEPPDSDDTRSWPVGFEDVLLAVPESHTLARRSTLKLRELAKQPFVWIRRDVAPRVYDAVAQACKAGGLTMQVVQEARDSSTLLDLVAGGFGLCFTVTSARWRLPQGVVLRRVSDLEVKLKLSFVWQRDDDSLALQALLDTIRTLSVARVLRPRIPGRARLLARAPRQAE